MRYFLWVDDKQDGPYEPAKIREAMSEGKITDATLARPETGKSKWRTIRNYPEMFEPPQVTELTLPQIEGSGVASALTFIAVLELIAAPLAGASYGSDHNIIVGWTIFLSGIISGLIFLGFARVIENTSQTSQRLKRIEMLMTRNIQTKTPADPPV